ncbi:MAG: 50S ribosomal protein L4, partial [Gemmatimonadetes bacterium]|nr:50S ribosomal protein L4 [Gemmatimonadota bacterium]
ALNDRAEAGRVVVIEAFDSDAPKTRWLKGLLSSMETEGKVLVLTDGVKKNVHLSGRNLPDVQVLPFGSESPYDVIWSGTVVIEKQALDSVPDDRSSERANRRRPVDPEALASAAAEQAERKAARKRISTSRRVRGDEIDTSASLVGASATKAEAAPAKAQAKTPDPEPAQASPEKDPEPPQHEAVSPAPEAPVAETAPVPAEEETSGFDPETVDLPKVADLADFLAGIDNVAHVEALQARDSRKTAAPIYAARIEELS